VFFLSEYRGNEDKSFAQKIAKVTKTILSIHELRTVNGHSLGLKYSATHATRNATLSSRTDTDLIYSRIVQKVSAILLGAADSDCNLIGNPELPLDWTVNDTLPIGQQRLSCSSKPGSGSYNYCFMLCFSKINMR
jgi:hypothetical protein